MDTAAGEDRVIGDRYLVKQGDNLWSIAARPLGGGPQWPRIWKYNNRRDIVRITGRTIPNPDLIYPDQILFIPRLPMTPVSPQPPLPPRRRARLPVALAPRAARRRRRRGTYERVDPRMEGVFRHLGLR